LLFHRKGGGPEVSVDPLSIALRKGGSYQWFEVSLELSDHQESLSMRWLQD
jgi:hypothetical protein